MNIIRRIGLLALDIDHAAMKTIVDIYESTGLYRRIFEAAGFSTKWSIAAEAHYIATMRYGIESQRGIIRRFVAGDKSARESIGEYVEWYVEYVERAFSLPEMRP